ncbi:hypothetical protein [Legionella brunensis]|uniref:Uncharacterized protein n=1 Tax=Legionella brunensis TaxID=29422 RepID=A0A0W0SK14_9GAMM|nr:hypothetical protein [Legionella brunensis]KTC83704.1 hypothetical protein Lbru_1673 [Legionella brunensis]
MALFLVIVFVVLFLVIGTLLPGGRPTKLNHDNNSKQTRYNPAAGLPMIGGLDCMGNSIGSSASDRNNYWNNHFHNHSTYNSSSYDPFNNRY